MGRVEDSEQGRIVDEIAGEFGTHIAAPPDHVVDAGFLR
jgi:hypothetical protein